MRREGKGKGIGEDGGGGMENERKEVRQKKRTPRLSSISSTSSDFLRTASLIRDSRNSGVFGVSSHSRRKFKASWFLFLNLK
jgi:hypothetical protein